MDNNHQPRNPESPTLAEAAEAVRKLAAVLEDHQLAQVEVTLGKLNIKLKAGKIVEHVIAAPAVEPVPAPADTGDDTGHIVAAPMIGTFYTAPSPGEPPFVAIGDAVEAGQTIGIIEAMKIMNEIASDRSGTVTEIFVANAQAVEYGSPLIRIQVG